MTLVLVKTGNGGKEPTPNPSQEGNNPCHPATRLNKMEIPIQFNYKVAILQSEMPPSHITDMLSRDLLLSFE